NQFLDIAQSLFGRDWLKASPDVFCNYCIYIGTDLIIMQGGMNAIIQHKQKNFLLSHPCMITYFQMPDQHFRLAAFNGIPDKVLGSIVSLQDAGNEPSIGRYGW